VQRQEVQGVLTCKKNSRVEALKNEVGEKEISVFLDFMVTFFRINFSELLFSNGIFQGYFFEHNISR
jgi:hypothetical protein